MKWNQTQLRIQKGSKTYSVGDRYRSNYKIVGVNDDGAGWLLTLEVINS